MRSSSTKDKTCRPRRRMATEKRYTSAQTPAAPRRLMIWSRRSRKFSLARSAQRLRARQQFHKFLRERRKLPGGYRAARVYDNVPSLCDFPSMQSQNFPQPSPDSVATYRISQRLFDAPSEPRGWEFIRAKENGEFTARSPPTLAVHRVIFRPLQQPAGAREGESWPVRPA